MDKMYQAKIDIASAKLSFLEAYMQANMTWWVSSTAFCATILAVLYNYKPNVTSFSPMYFRCLWVGVFAFFTSILSYGAFIGWQAWIMNNKAQVLLNDININETTINEFWVVAWMIWIGTTSFAIILGLACILCNKMMDDRKGKKNWT